MHSLPIFCVIDCAWPVVLHRGTSSSSLLSLLAASISGTVSIFYFGCRFVSLSTLLSTSLHLVSFVYCGCSSPLLPLKLGFPWFFPFIFFLSCFSASSDCSAHSFLLGRTAVIADRCQLVAVICVRRWLGGRRPLVAVIRVRRSLGGRRPLVAVFRIRRRLLPF